MRKLLITLAALSATPAMANNERYKLSFIAPENVLVEVTNIPEDYASMEACTLGMRALKIDNSDIDLTIFCHRVEG